MRKAIIGIAANQDKDYKEYRLNKSYLDAIISAGGLPVVLPIVSDESIIKEYIKVLDGLLLTGGADPDPLIYGENSLPFMGSIDPLRDNFELQVFKYAFRADLSILGICKGIQIINIAMGGTLYQDLHSQRKGVLKHNQEAPNWYPTHSVSIEADSYLNQIVKKGKMEVNSIHHQSVKDVSPKFLVSAKAEDGVIEAIELKEKRFVMGVQWHPETMWEKSQENFNIFKEFVYQSERGGLENE